MQSGEPVEPPRGAPSGLATPGDHEDVTGAHPDALGPLRQLEVGHGDHLAVPEEVAPEGPGDVQQDAPPHHSVGQGQHRVRLRPVAAHLGRGSTAVHAAAHEHVGQGVDVGGPEAVYVERQMVPRRLVPGDPVRVACVPRGQHVVLDRVRVLGQGLGGEVVGQADRLAGPHRPGGGGAALVGQEVERPLLVVVTPPAPVRQPVEERVHLVGGRDRVLGGHAAILSVGTPGVTDRSHRSAPVAIRGAGRGRGRPPGPRSSHRCAPAPRGW